ncbi:MAG: FecR domain-containing protein [Gammaproteobacteria bacterium]
MKHSSSSPERGNRPERSREEMAQFFVAQTAASARASEAFAGWLTQSPLNVEAYLRMLAVERELEGARFDTSIDVDELVRRGTGQVVPLRLSLLASPKRRPHVLARWLLAVAASLCALSMLLYFGLGGPASSLRANSYRTLTGEQRQILLPDGTLIHLNTESTLEVRFSDTERDVVLVNGEALFKVAPDARRPFRVIVDGTTIRDIGTEFSVYKTGAAFTIAVLEGEVEVDAPSASTSPRVTAGETAQVESHGTVFKRKSQRAEDATVWQQRMLMFDATPLEEIAAQFNRYNLRPKVRVEGDVRSRQFNGLFRADDPGSFVQSLSADPGLAIERQADEVLIRQR